MKRFRRPFDGSDDDQYEQHDMYGSEEMSYPRAKRRRTVAEDPDTVQHVERAHTANEREEKGLFVTPDPEDHRDYVSHSGLTTRSESPLFVSEDDEQDDGHGGGDVNSGPDDGEQTMIQQPPIPTPRHQVNQSTNVEPPLRFSQLLALPAGPLVAPIPYPVIARTTRGYVEMTQQQVDNQEGLFRKATYQCLYPDCANNRGKGYATEQSRDEHWSKHEPGYMQFRGGMRGLQTYDIL